MSVVCVACGTSLSGPLLKCATCQSYQGSACSNCGILLPPNAVHCNSCQRYQAGEHCPNCGALKPAGDLRCAKCQAFTDWRRLVPRSEVVLALGLSILSMLAAVIPPAVRWWRDRSDTEIRVLGVEDYMPTEGDLSASVPMIRVAVTNTGTRPSFVRSATISFGQALGIGNLPLEIAEVRERSVRPDEISYLHLSSRSFTGKAFDSNVLHAHDVTIALDVEETLRLGGRQVESRPDTVRAIDIERWLTHGTN